MESSLIKSKSRFLNRELSWLGFNNRVLEEALNKNHPLFERWRFLAISASNLDEFFMVRVAGLKGQKSAAIDSESLDGLTPSQQLVKINIAVKQLQTEQQSTYVALLKELKKHKIGFINENELKSDEKLWLDKYFMEQVFLSITPLVVDLAHPFPFIHNAGLVLALELISNDKKQDVFGLIMLPPSLDRFIRLPRSMRFIALEDVLLLYIDKLFPNFTIKNSAMFKVIRDSEMEFEEDAEDLVVTFESMLLKRRRGNAIRLEVSSGASTNLCDFIVKKLKVDSEYIYKFSSKLGLCDISDIINSENKDLVFPKFNARFPERIRDFNGDCFAAINAKDIVIHHPYESFSVVVSFLTQAAEDKNVIAIKQTLYRTSNNSPIVKALIAAAQAGKSVTALVELKARFDEAANIRWARELEAGGVQVVYGFIELKTHAKISMVVRREGKSLRSYVQFGTGNYHPITAKIYTDLSYFTCDPAYARDAAKAFNYMTGSAKPDDFEKLSISPFSLRKTLIDEINNEISNAKKNKPAEIWLKSNSLVDPGIIDALYKASNAGVKIEIVARGICCLRPGIKGLSSNIKVKSIVGRYLEHSRIYCFANGNKLPSSNAKTYISSADLMSRNLNRRMETMVPIENSTVKKQILEQVMYSNIHDKAQSWQMNSDGSYNRLNYNEKSFNLHKFFMTNPSLSGRGSAIRKKFIKKKK